MKKKTMASVIDSKFGEWYAEASRGGDPKIVELFNFALWLALVADGQLNINYAEDGSPRFAFVRNEECGEDDKEDFWINRLYKENARLN